MQDIGNELISGVDPDSFFQIRGNITPAIEPYFRQVQRALQAEGPDLAEQAFLNGLLQIQFLLIAPKN